MGDGPDYRETKAIPRVQVPAEQLAEVLALARSTNETVNGLTTKVDELGGTVGELVEWKGQVEARLKSNSIRASQTSELDEKQNLAIAAAAAREAELQTNAREAKELASKALERVEVVSSKTDEQTALLVELRALITELRSIAASPLVRKIAYGVAILILGWLASKGVHFDVGAK